MQESLQNAVTDDDDDDRRRRRQTPRVISYAAIGPMVHGCKKIISALPPDAIEDLRAEAHVTGAIT